MRDAKMPKKKVKKVSLPLAPFEKIMREAGAKRVSKSGTQEFVIWLEETARDYAGDIFEIIKAGPRKTATAQDVKLAKNLRKRRGL